MTPLATAVGYLRHRGRSTIGTFPLEAPLLGPEEIEAYAGPPLEGTLNLGGYGGGLDPFLVVVGSERGHVWLDALGSDGGILPFTIEESGHLHDETRSFPETFDEMVLATRMTFSAWYEDWLSSAERLAR